MSHILLREFWSFPAVTAVLCQTVLISTNLKADKASAEISIEGVNLLEKT